MNTQAHLAARVVVVTPPQHSVPREGFQEQLLKRWVTLKEVEGPLINGAVILTWEDDPSPDDSLVAHSAQIVDDLLVQPCD